ncbi:hypothetical protein DXN05_09320 [Deminuibacter soli]|uniref:Uncharacterized protein n=1 Tax=Deminuibacter soli TaxID=2291815 RepID=A0A3E1NMA0_9BACT|nr:hypothetical protein DXN05_09320 [Deminuibacter soli]
MILAKIVSTCRFSKMVLAQIISTVDVSILENGTRYDHSRLKNSCKLQAISFKLVQYISPPAKVMILAKIVSTCRFSKIVLAQIISTVDVSILENATRYDHS